MGLWFPSTVVFSPLSLLTDPDKALVVLRDVSSDARHRVAVEPRGCLAWNERGGLFEEDVGNVKP